MFEQQKLCGNYVFEPQEDHSLRGTWTHVASSWNKSSSVGIPGWFLFASWSYKQFTHYNNFTSTHSVRFSYKLDSESKYMPELEWISMGTVAWA